MTRRVLLVPFLVAAAVAATGLALRHPHAKPTPPPFPNPALTSYVWKASVAGGRPTLLFRDRGRQDGLPLVLPDGKTIVFERPTSRATTALFALSPGDRHPRLLRRLPVFARLGYSSGGGGIAVQRGHAIVAESVRGRRLRVLAHVHGSSWSVPAWSADGNTLAYAQTVRNRAELVVARAGRTRRFPLAASPAPLALSPDGRRLVFAWGTALWILDTENGTRRLLAERASPDAAWAPDGRTIAYDDASGLVALDVASGRRHVVSARGGAPAFTPDGRQIVFVTLR